jgi:FkbM family methyltransferase
VVGWGSVHAFECQERLFYALCGNVALNNLSNVRAFLGAVTETNGDWSRVPQLNFDAPGSYGSLSITSDEKSSDVGQDVTTGLAIGVRTYSLDAFFSIGRVDFVKIDVEGMELNVLEGGTAVIDREKPVLIVEHLKSDKAALRAWVEARGYAVFEERNNLLCIHRDDPCLNHVKDSQ